MDDITGTTTAEPAQTEQSRSDDFNKEEWAAKKQAERAEIFERTDAIIARVAEDPEVLRSYLITMSRFPNYSANNTLLIFDQNPGATRVGDYEFWQKKGAQVKKNEKGILILEPGSAYEREDGSFGTSYNVKRVFDISQTTARPRQQKEPDIRTLLKALVEESPVKIEKVALMPDGMGAFYEHEANTLSVRDDLPADELFKVLSTQIAALYLREQDSSANSTQIDGNSHIAGFVICKHYGIEVDGLKLSLPAYEASNPAEIRAELVRVQGAVKEVTGRVNDNIREAKAAREAAMER